jgi:hypothetical protein
MLDETHQNMMFGEDVEMMTDLKQMFDKFFKEKIPTPGNFFLAMEDKFLHLARSVMISYNKL